MRVFVFLSLLFFTGCTEPMRNSVQQQVEDKETCVKGGMKYATNGFGEVKCVP